MKKNKVLEDTEVMITNKLTRAAQALTLAEKRLIFSAIAKMGNNFQEKGEVIILAREYADTFEMPVDQAYEQLRDASENLFQRYFTLNKKDRIGVMKWKVRYVEAAGYDKGNARVGVTFTQTIRPYLCNIHEAFTKYHLKQAGALRSVNSWRMLEQFMMLKDTGWWKISVEDFCTMFDATDICRRNFAELNRRIIMPAMNELIKKDDWIIGFEYEKRGRKVHMLKFTFEKDKQQSLF
jgi:plasmid replication initiation protein